MSLPKNHHNNKHTPVLLEQTLALLDPKPSESYLDLTAGYGGHAKAILNITKSEDKITLVDRDQNAINLLKEKFKNANVIKSDFATAAQDLIENNKKFDLVVADLGVSSPQLDNADRGFSFRFDAPLDMRMDQQQETTAKDLLEQLTEDELYQIIKKYGQEPKANRIAGVIKQNLPVETTTQLAELVEQVYHHRGKIHPATRTFQAIRIALNDELNQIHDLTKLIPQLLNPGGRVAIISFHSLEDKIIKDEFREQSSSGYESTLKLINKKPISGDEDVHNPRARSAKLRAAVKI